MLHIENKTFPVIKIPFSKFAELHPKWCMLAGARSSVCVCMKHQIVKLMISATKTFNNMKRLIEKVA